MAILVRAGFDSGRSGYATIKARGRLPITFPGGSGSPSGSRDLMHGIRQPLLRRRLPWLAALLACIAALGVAVTASATVVAIDGVLAAIVRPDAGGAATAWIEAVTALGSTDIVLLVTVIGALLLLGIGHWHASIALALSVAATQAIVAVLKALVERPRPEGSTLADASGFSFPSGHSATSVALYVALGLLVAGAIRGRGPRVAALAAGACVALAVGASRVYLGVHYPVDVVAGWLTGGAVVIVCWAAASRLRAASTPPAPA